MNEEELEIARKIADIECVEYGVARSMLNEFRLLLPPDGLREYNPFSWGILGPLMVKYEVYVNHSSEYVFILTNDIHEDLEVLFDNKSEIPMAILKCIIKSQEK